MNVLTTRFGTIGVADDACLSFPSGILGFPALRRFVLLKTTDLGLFRWLQSAEVPALVCLVCNPRLVLHDYAVRVQAQLLADIHVTRADQADLLVMVSYPLDKSLMTADLQRPIVCNRDFRLAKHLSLPAGSYSRAHRVFGDQPVASAQVSLPPDHPLELSA